MYIGEKYQDYLFKNQVNSKANRKSQSPSQTQNKQSQKPAHI